MRILTIAEVPCDPNAGAAGTVHATNAALVRLGHEVDAVWSDSLPRKIHHGNLHSLLEQPRAYCRVMCDKLRAGSYDVVQISQPQAWRAAQEFRRRGYPGVFINRSHGLELRVDAVVPGWHTRLGVPENRFPRSVLSQPLRRMLQRQWPRVAAAADGIILPCEDDREYLLSHLDVDPDKVRVIHHGVPELFLETQPADWSPERTKRLLYVGQFAFIKGPHILAETFNRVLQHDAECTATWVCESRHHAAAAALLDQNVLDRVRFLDWRQQSELLSLYDEHGLFVFPSFFEGAAKAVLEALSRGLCVITTAAGGMQDPIEPGQSGHVVPAGDVDAIFAKIKPLLGNQSLCRNMSAAARESVASYTWDRCANEATDFYRERCAAKARLEGFSENSWATSRASI